MSRYDRRAARRAARNNSGCLLGLVLVPLALLHGPGQPPADPENDGWPPGTPHPGGPPPGPRWTP